MEAGDLISGRRDPERISARDTQRRIAPRRTWLLAAAGISGDEKRGAHR
jgi:hypothetical protein